MGQKVNPCTYCGATNHSSVTCFRKPRKAIPVRKPLKATTSPKVKKKATQATKRPTKRPKVQSRSQVVKTLDSVFSQYIRLKAMNRNGLVQCVTCPTQLEPKYIQNGHYYSRAKYPTRWHEDNCHPQCARCNIFLKGNYTEYALFMVRKYGVEKVEQMRELSVTSQKITTAELKEQIAYYRSLIRKMI